MKMKTLYQLSAAAIFILCSIFNSAFAQNKLSKILPANSNVLFIQIANSGELIPNKTEPNSYTLVLKQVDPFTSYFTDRPNRVTGMLATHQFINLWKGEKAIDKAPPNVAMETSVEKSGKKINCVFMLSNPIYDSAKHEVTYVAKLLDKKTCIKERLTIGYTVLFIDDFNWNGNKFG